MTEFVKFRQDIKSQIVHLLGNVPYKGVIWEWQFENGPFHDEFDPVVVAESGVIVGFNGVMPIAVYYKGVEIGALWSCDFYVDDNYRGRGLGKDIKTELIRRSPLIMSLGVSQTAARVLSKMGWVSSREIHSYRRIRRASTIKTFLIFCLQLWNRALGSVRSFEHSLVVDFGPELPSHYTVNALWGHARSTYSKIVVRNWDYLDWKYQQHPLAQYQFGIVRDGADLRAILVIREHLGVLRIVDYLGRSSDYDAARAVCQKLLSDYPNASVISCTTSSKTLSRAFLDCGFFRSRTQPRFFVRSSIPEDNDSECDWFIMGGDSDGELLLAASEAMAIPEPL